MLIILHKGGSLLKVVAIEVVAQLINEFGYYWNTVSSDNYALHFHGSDFCVPVVSANVSNADTLGRISIQDLFH